MTAQRIGAGNVRAAAVLGVEDIQERPLGADVTQSLAKVPGVQVSSGDARGGSFSFELYLRGLNKEQVGLTLDGIPTGDARFNGGSPPQRFIESSNISRINVSQSAGDIGAPSRFALGGFVDFITADPRDNLGVTVEAGVGSDNFYRGYVRLDTGELLPGLTSYLSYSHQENDIWAGPRSRHSRRDHIEFKAVQDLADGGFIKFRAAYNDQRDNDFNIISLAEFKSDPRNDRALDALTGIPALDLDYGGALGGTRKDFLAYINTRFYLADDVSFSINPYYQQLRGESSRYQDRQRRLTGEDPYAVLGYNALGGAIRPALVTTRNSNIVGGPADMRLTPRDADRMGVTGEFQFKDFLPGNTLRVGGWWENAKASETRNFYPILNSAQSIAIDRADLAYVEYDRRSTIDTSMLYVQDQFDIIPDMLRLDAGLTWFNVAYRARSPLEYRQLVRFDQSSGINPKIGIGFRPVKGLEIFAGYAQNFAGIPEDAFLGSNSAINPRDLVPIETENMDAGVRFTADHIALSLQGYYTRLKNNIGTVPTSITGVDPDEIIRGNVTTRAANIAGTKSKGIEATAILDYDWVNFYLSYSYQDARHDDPAVGSAARLELASVGVIGGARVRDIPTNSLFGQVEIKPFEGASLQLSGRYVGRRVGAHLIQPTTNREMGVEYLPSYTVVGLNASYGFGDTGPFKELKLQFNVDNLFNEKYVGAVTSSTATLPDFGLAGTGTVPTLDRYFIGAPRTVTASLRARF
ncbi:TonB-dependent receptor [Sphingopyxis sp. DBS4]|uniref:TonB-dependent receptor n=1 Tax=Sphingopyxis sp. DBS4 TaxID=2968500 RepID=UPI00214C34B5|nr:TonB-dependent receptor [Sphingopyxis sp. DBS4]